MCEEETRKGEAAKDLARSATEGWSSKHAAVQLRLASLAAPPEPPKTLDDEAPALEEENKKAGKAKKLKKETETRGGDPQLERARGFRV